MQNLTKEFLNVEELGEMLGVSKTTIYKWVEGNFIPHYRLGAKIRFNRNEVLEWAKKRGSRGSNGRNRKDKVNQYQ